ncbi:hypothetical protein [Psychroserpens luteolus]|uniref:hypothetical protein n=1 Tax=Psychroserpens luteolus TaxID=2855840 RepID=UPI001E57E770|nr:hypothetical protein [Psychroserpens luteolus]MCD2258937.1 hypothetical protein [Psychroserpens luteolus]
MLKKVKKEDLKSDLEDATMRLLQLARQTCWNTISSNAVYIISEIEKNPKDIHINTLKSRKKKNDKKTVKSLEQITQDLNNIYDNLYDINLYVYKSTTRYTIIEIQYFPKSSLEASFLKTVKEERPMLHSKITFPIYRKNNSEKFDVNWELQGLRYKWNMFWHRLLVTKKI